MLAELKQFKDTATTAEGVTVEKGEAVEFMAKESLDLSSSCGVKYK